MKQKILNKLTILVFTVICMPLMACSQTRILSDLPTGNGVEKVYIGNAMIKMAGNMGMAGNSLGEFKDAIKDIKGIEVYDCENKSLIPTARNKFAELVKKYHAEIILESEEENETAVIYILMEEKDPAKPMGMAIMSTEKGEISIVIIHGTIDLNKIAQK